jgi:hypothetical protein
MCSNVSRKCGSLVNLGTTVKFSSFLKKSNCFSYPKYKAAVRELDAQLRIYNFDVNLAGLSF